MALKFITAEEAASYVHHNDNVGFSGFTPAGCPKVVPGAIARKAAEEHAKGNPFQIGMFTGASTGDKLDGELARANAIKFRTPYQSNKDLRAALNAHQAQYFDLHLSELAQSLRYGFLGKIDVARLPMLLRMVRSFRLQVLVSYLLSVVWQTVSSLS